MLGADFNMNGIYFDALQLASGQFMTIFLKIHIIG